MSDFQEEINRVLDRHHIGTYSVWSDTAFLRSVHIVPLDYDDSLNDEIPHVDGCIWRGALYGLLFTVIAFAVIWILAAL